MDAFLIDLKNKPGEFARVAEAIAAKGVNITGVSGASCGDGGRVALVTADPAATKQALAAANIAFKTMEVTETSLADRPGSLAEACRRLADKGINIESVMALGMNAGQISVGFVTGDPMKAREVLSHAGAASR